MNGFDHHQPRIKFIGLAAVLDRHGGMGRSTAYKLQADGLIPPSVPVSSRRVAWIEAEIDAVLAARAAGKSDEEIRTLVSRIVADRQAAAPRITTDEREVVAAGGRG